MTGRPALFLDRDGVINEEVGYLWRPEDCRLVEGIGPLILAANALNVPVVVITNQSGIARGLYTEEDFHRLMDHIHGALRLEGARLDAVYFCPLHPEHGVGRYRCDSDDRKPGPGMLLRAARELGINLSESVLVGDRCTDLEAGASAGLRRLFLFGNTEKSPCGLKVAYTRVNSLAPVTQTLASVRATFQVREP